MQKIKLCCVITPRPDMPFLEQAEQACRGGADAVRLRGETLSARELLANALKLREVCRQYKALLIIDGRPDIALACNADGVHLDSGDIPPEPARQILGPRRAIGCAVSSLGQALAAAKEGADYISVGPVFSGGEGASSIDVVRLIRKRVRAQVLAAGGVTLENAAEAVREGADGVVVSRAVCGAPDVEAAARRMKEKILKTEEEQATLKNE